MGYFANAQYDVKAQGYFANAQYDVKAQGYFANAKYDVKAQGYFACAQYDVLFFTSSCQCRASKLACKGLRATIFIRHLHFLTKNAENGSFNARALSAE